MMYVRSFRNVRRTSLFVLDVNIHKKEILQKVLFVQEICVIYIWIYEQKLYIRKKRVQEIESAF